MEPMRLQARPFLRWAGSKKQLLPEIAKYWRPEYERYVEPFCGSASLFFRLNPKSAFLSDLNRELIDALRQIQVSPNQVAECLARLAPDKDTYYAVRAQSPDSLAPNERAARFLYLNHHCFNGLYRVNKAGKFNVPYCASKKRASLTPEELRIAGALLVHADLRCGDFEEVINACQRGDFLYADPPYASSADRNGFVEYARDGFTERDIARLFKALARATRRGVKFVLSYADVPDVLPYTKEYEVRRVAVRRNIAGFTGARRTVNELLVANCEAANV